SRDWSSDVCSSDLERTLRLLEREVHDRGADPIVGRVGLRWGVLGRGPFGCSVLRLGGGVGLLGHAGAFLNRGRCYAMDTAPVLDVAQDRHVLAGGYGRVPAGGHAMRPRRRFTALAPSYRPRSTASARSGEFAPRAFIESFDSTSTSPEPV